MLMDCRKACGACCIAPSINSPIPGMPNGKAAGERCVQLDDAMACKLFGHPSRPVFCSQFQAEPEVCGESRDQALACISGLETITRVSL